MGVRWKQAVCGALLLFLFCGCVPNSEYLKISEHNNPFAQKEETQPTETEAPDELALTADDYYGLRSALSQLVKNGVEHGRIQLEQYAGDPDEDLKRAVAYLTEEDPVGAYAIDFINYDCLRQKDLTLVTVDAVYRRSASEIAAIRSVRGTDQAEQQIFEALARFDSAITLRVSGYAEHDYEAAIHRYCVTNPDKVPEIPTVSAAVYPQTGNVRILELHMSYPVTKEEMHSELSEISGIFTSAYSYLRYGATQQNKLDLACTYLSGRFDYVPDPEATVYTLLGQGRADSLTAASAFYGILQRAGFNERLVEGMKDGEPYAWLILSVDGVWVHVDVYRELLEKHTEPACLLDEDMTGFQWDREAYPVCDGIPQE